MSALRRSHVVWLMRRAATLDGTSADAAEPADPGRAALLHRVVAKVSEAIEAAGPLGLSPAERMLLATEAHELADRASREMARPGDDRDLRRSEEWLLTARALREVVEASP
ncbi:MAG TPA: hypothetical protein VM076_14910 [Gemmatimonadaceae bacterium]|nr:hypothetical protein [Gemmatimonadaceae bacterium]